MTPSEQRKARNADVITVYPVEDWHEDYGDVLWWHFPVCEPPIVGCGTGMGAKNADGTPTTCHKLIESGWLTHWSRIPIVFDGDGTPLRAGRVNEVYRCRFWAPRTTFIESPNTEVRRDFGQCEKPRGHEGPHKNGEREWFGGIEA